MTRPRDESGIDEGWELPDLPTMSPQATFRLFGIVENTGYRAVAQGMFPIRPIRITRKRYVFSTAEIRRVLKLS